MRYGVAENYPQQRIAYTWSSMISFPIQSHFMLGFDSLKPS